MRMTFVLREGARVDAHAAGFTIPTDQPPDATAPMPFTLFLASIGSCAAFYVQSFCRKRDIPTDGITVTQDSIAGPTGLVERVQLRVELPPEFPERYRSAVIRAAEQCTVKKHLAHPPTIDIETQVAAPA